MKHFFYKGDNELLSGKEEFEDKLKIVKKELSKILETRNLSILLGSGCSLGDFGIPTMKQLADTFFEQKEENITKLSPTLQSLLLNAAHILILEKYNIDFLKEPFRNNLEIFLGTLYSIRFYLVQVKNDAEVIEIDLVIEQTKNFILYKCLNEENKGKDGDIQENYKNFYRKLSLRDSNLPKPNIFTTNYDLYSEKSMDELGITYTNGFSGFIERYFNPSIFNYALAEQMDISSLKWNVIDSFIYLFKIHGSVNWIEVEETNKLFNVQELQSVDFDFLSKTKNHMIYPSPIKQNASLGSPYSDLFREFQKRIAQNQSVLITMGYSFSDEHINNLIYQALTIPTFRLVVFTDTKYWTEEGTKSRENIDKLIKLNDPRIWIIGTNDSDIITTPTEVIPTTEDGKLESLGVIEKESPMIQEENMVIAKKVIEIDGKTETIVKEPIPKEKKLHFFNTIINDLLPDWTENKIELQNAEIIKLLHKNSDKSQE
jgi:hypothetical protein